MQLTIEIEAKELGVTCFVEITRFTGVIHVHRLIVLHFHTIQFPRSFASLVCCHHTGCGNLSKANIRRMKLAPLIGRKTENLLAN